jgi:hypothetical protein
MLPDAAQIGRWGGRAAYVWTVEGKERCRQAPWRHGGRSAKARNAAARRGAARRLITSMRALIREITGGGYSPTGAEASLEAKVVAYW